MFTPFIKLKHNATLELATDPAIQKIFNQNSSPYIRFIYS